MEWVKNAYRTQGTIKINQYMHYGSPGRKRKGAGNLFENIISEKSPNMGKESNIHIQETKSLKQDPPKEECNKIHCN